MTAANPPARKETLFILGLVLATIVPVVILLVRQPKGEAIHIRPLPPTVTLAPTLTPHPLRVYVSGAVLHADVYLLPTDGIAKDAVVAAGGLVADADDGPINLAAPLQDNQHLYIPYRSDGWPTPTPAVTRSRPASAGGSGEDRVIPVAGTSPAPKSPVDINTASEAELDSLPHIGPATAKAIIDYRQKHGPFQTTRDILKVAGIGPATYERIKDLICVCS